MDTTASADALATWAGSLAAARLCGGTLPDPPQPITLAEGYELAARAAPGLGTPAGWKIGATSEGAMAFLGVSEPIRGRLFAERLWHDGARADLAGDRDAEAEPEIAFRLARPLAAGGDPLAAIGTVHAAAEIVRSSHPEPFRLGSGFIVADNAAGLGALIGPEIPRERLVRPDLLAVTLHGPDGASVTGRADAVLGDPLRALSWLAEALGEVPAGTWVLTGAMARAIPVPPGGSLRLDAGEFGGAVLNL